MSKSKIAAGLMVGAVVGACAAILMAPEKGSETRKFIADQLKKFGKDQAEFMRKNVQQLLGKASEEVNSVHRDFSEAIN